ncbi:SWIM zinc finger family protein [Peterkaempfera bronchialis]|uniref:SWIM zinc finger family protein n=1 Tax=Peterkaempfera bronchialis TaxID=2126346 RepID=A0A345SW57_9ACTN|nr:SWIM zinc finger family protein [Peterkaempfera bronchialis]AXI77962.1 SWIM zinc finger family protein [Peterkaempfera bronchialis]
MSVTSNDVRWTADQVLALAPDAASRKAAAKLASPAPWSGAGTGDGAVWGECRGSGSAVYRTAVELAAPAYSCTCPSRKFPCKHALGLLLRWAAGPESVPAAAEPAGWAASWLTARRERAEQRDATRAAAPAADPEAARRRAERRAARVAEGAAELRLRLADRLRGGLAGEERAGYGAWDDVAARMVDAQAPGLASLARELATVPGSGPGWPARLLEQYALLDLLAAAYGRVDRLPEPLAATVRARVGFTMEGSEVLRAGPAVRDRWLVLGVRDTADDRLTTRRLWLRGAGTGRTALLLSFGRPGRAPDLALPTGLAVEADLAYHPGVRPLRAVLGPDRLPAAPAPPEEAVPPGVTVDRALAEYGAALAEEPWLDSWPVVLAGVVPVPAPDGWRLVDGDGGEQVPVHRQGSAAGAGLWRLAAVSGGRPVTVFGECGHRGFSPVTVWDADGTAIGLCP